MGLFGMSLFTSAITAGERCSFSGASMIAIWSANSSATLSCVPPFQVEDAVGDFFGLHGDEAVSKRSLPARLGLNATRRVGFDIRNSQNQHRKASLLFDDACREFDPPKSLYALYHASASMSPMTSLSIHV